MKDAFKQEECWENICTVPGDHLLLFVRSTATAAQVPAGRGQEVQAVVLKRLVCERKQNLESRAIFVRPNADYRNIYVQLNLQTLAKNLISWS